MMYKMNDVMLFRFNRVLELAELLDLLEDEAKIWKRLEYQEDYRLEQAYLANRDLGCRGRLSNNVWLDMIEHRGEFADLLLPLQAPPCDLVQIRL